MQASLPLVAAALSRLYSEANFADTAEVLIVLRATILIRLRNDRLNNLSSDIVIVDMCSLLKPESASEPASSIVKNAIEGKASESGQSLKVDCDACDDSDLRLSDSHPLPVVEPEDIHLEDFWFGKLTIGRVAIASALIATAVVVFFPPR